MWLNEKKHSKAARGKGRRGKKSQRLGWEIHLLGGRTTPIKNKTVLGGLLKKKRPGGRVHHREGREKPTVVHGERKKRKTQQPLREEKRERGEG